MDKLVKYTEALLYTHDCVLIPNLGGFVASRKPASKVGQYLLPQRKELGFNSKLNNNDGLLSQHMALQEGISFDQALKYIQTVVNQIHLALNRNQTIFWGNIGSMKRSEEGAIIFSPTQEVYFLPESFGLGKIELFPLAKQENTLTPSKQSKPVIPISREKAQKNHYWIAGIAASLVLFLMAPGRVSDHPIQEAGFLPSSTHYESRQSTVEEQSTTASDFDYLKVQDDSPYTYHVIVASCTSKARAKNHAKRLQLKGIIQPEIIYGGKERYRISARSFTNKQEAELALASIKNKYPRMKDAWVLRSRN